jgi:hypothetical protein
MGFAPFLARLGKPAMAMSLLFATGFFMLASPISAMAATERPPPQAPGTVQTYPFGEDVITGHDTGGPSNSWFHQTVHVWVTLTWGCSIGNPAWPGDCDQPDHANIYGDVHTFSTAALVGFRGTFRVEMYPQDCGGQQHEYGVDGRWIGRSDRNDSFDDPILFQCVRDDYYAGGGVRVIWS